LLWSGDWSFIEPNTPFFSACRLDRFLLVEVLCPGSRLNLGERGVGEHVTLAPRSGSCSLLGSRETRFLLKKQVREQFRHIFNNIVIAQAKTGFLFIDTPRD
jgi:hypothetical protein